MFAPYQCLEVAGNFLIAASGHELHTFNLQTGDQVSSWACAAPIVDTKASAKAAKEAEKVVLDVTPDSEENAEAGSENPPAKRRKISDDETKEVKGDENTEEGKKNGRPKAKQVRPAVDGSVAPNFIALASTKDGRHVIGVTGEDKSVRVFEHLNGVLNQISERSMAKRPCAIGLTSSDSLIITADKFGDVFSLPLQVPESTGEEKAVEAAVAPEEPKQFVSSANDLTVHSARNRRALENQLKQNLVKAEKSELNAGQTLLLGHVSMLTDIALIEREGRSYIVTADRDEHIRVSRGIPQAHIIENYCFGHTDFVSKLCFPESAPHLMISGGGDDDLYVWEWKTGKLLQRSNLVPLVERINGAKADGEKTKVVVSGIKHLHAGGDFGSVAVTCEGVPAVFIFSLSSTSGLQFVNPQCLSGNALAMASVAQAGLIVSIDTIHKAGSTTVVRGEEPIPVLPLEAFELGDRTISTSVLRFKPTEASGLDSAKWSSLLYSLGNLRKRAGEE